MKTEMSALSAQPGCLPSKWALFPARPLGVLCRVPTVLAGDSTTSLSHTGPCDLPLTTHGLLLQELDWRSWTGTQAGSGPALLPAGWPRPAPDPPEHQFALLSLGSQEDKQRDCTPGVPTTCVITGNVGTDRKAAPSLGTHGSGTELLSDPGHGARARVLNEDTGGTCLPTNAGRMQDGDLPRPDPQGQTGWGALGRPTRATLLHVCGAAQPPTHILPIREHFWIKRYQQVEPETPDRAGLTLSKPGLVKAEKFNPGSLDSRVGLGGVGLDVGLGSTSSSPL